jgi:peptidoglycan-associated lipoprotein
MLTTVSWVLLISLLLVGCESQVQGPPKWTVENPNASAGLSKGVRQPTEPKREVAASTSSSLDALRMGESTATPASSPIKDVYFDFDRHELTAEAREILKNNTQWLKAHPTVHVQIEGHCDERGTVEYNLALGARRAQSVKEYLTSLGIAVERLSDISYGEEIPVCREQTEACWQKNRRARFVITGGAPTS